MKSLFEANKNIAVHNANYIMAIGSANEEALNKLAYKADWARAEKILFIKKQKGRRT